MKKLFGELNITWKKLIIAAIIIGVTVGLLNSVPFLKDSSLTDPAIYFDFWVLIGILLISNSKSNLDSSLKCFAFFLISQPLIYLVEVPFNSRGWELFVYYKPWFIWTLFCFPMGYIGYYIKKDKWWGLLILFPMLLLVGSGVLTYMGKIPYSFPRHILSYLFCVVSLIIYPLYLFNNKKIKIVGLIISSLLVIGATIMAILNPSVYDTTIMCSNEEHKFDDSFKVSLTNNLGEAYIEYLPSIEDYCVHTKFVKEGKTSLMLESSDGVKEEYKLVVGDRTYTIEKVEDSQNDD